MIRSSLRPGQGFKKFTRMKHKTGKSKTGRAGSSTFTESGYLFGILTDATPEEIERWGTTEKPITHKIVQYGGNNIAVAMDALVFNGRYFYIQRSPRNPGGLGHFTVYYCEERRGLNV